MIAALARDVDGECLTLLERVIFLRACRQMRRFGIVCRLGIETSLLSLCVVLKSNV